MSLYKRYIDGETEAVYDEIEKLEEKAFHPEYLADIEKVLTETFSRTAQNLQVIYEELLKMNYLFNKAPESNFQRPLHPPIQNTDELLKRLDEEVEPFGFVPLSLKYFYKIVGGVNFCWDYETGEDFLWRMADPIQVFSLDAIVSDLSRGYWKQEMDEYAEEDEFFEAYLDLSPDDLHKDDISGDIPYAIEVTPKPSIDALFMNEPNNTTFINYLRISFEYCGFPGLARSSYDNDYQGFFDRVKPKLQRI